MKFLKRYWWVVLLFITAPIILNFLLSIPAFTKIVGADTDWLSFWGGYLGAILSALVAFYVLSRQLAQNQEQNDANRKGNETENQFNRDLQVKIMEYQLGLNNLNQFKKACINCQEAYSYNNLCHIANLTHENNKVPLTKIAEYMGTAAAAKRGIDIIDFTDSQASKELLCLNCKLYHEYSEALLDLEVLVSYLNFNSDKAIAGLMSDIHSSNKLRPIISKHIEDISIIGVNAAIDKMISERLDLYEPNAIEELWQKAFVFIREEQKRISIPNETNSFSLIDGNE